MKEARPVWGEACRNVLAATPATRFAPTPRDPTPSPEDIEVTKQLVAAGRLLDIDLLDHIIIGDQGYLSLKERMRW